MPATARLVRTARPDAPTGDDESAETLLSTEPEAMRRMNRTEVRAHTDRMLRRLARLDEGTDEYSRTRATLIELNTGLVRHIVRGFGRRPETFEDVYQTGVVGLIKAIDRYDPERGVEFVAFATPTITGEIKRFFRDTSWGVHVSRGRQELFLAVVKAGDRLQAELGRDATAEEIAAHLGVTPEEVGEGRDAGRAFLVDSLDAPTATEDRQAATRGDMIGAEDPELDLVDFRASITPLIRTLSEREQLILRWRFWDDLTQRQIGDRLGLSQMHISRLLTGILVRLREHLEADPAVSGHEGD
ncbi:SigB/SigF/SigG family RNA polymerase sigma factor [Yinghuangia sp. ASG 101]|uniref:SigB/SigF/SigG family RNA polymerase sigma factor n=1 Tax=Yinghuangia sp. ASG 101 TaxID=2896848 RepID=UPI001E2F1310|nr:SigB/SigF/SigG family RNA polymerase sigma factor [Yinghuangia sp. ASG 101]UGQ12823.1 SigB/SigF/SigG family RNA polymerase sigma factor [Yinghuangia sp. ASG 101]